MRDFPGLSAPRVIAARRKLGETYRAVIPELHPTWIVLRARFSSNILLQGSRILDGYDLVQTWDVSHELEAISVLPGRGLLDYDSSYVIFRRRAAP